MRRVTLSMPLTVGEDEYEAVAVAARVSRRLPARGPSLADPGAPAEPGEVELEQVALETPLGELDLLPLLSPQDRFRLAMRVAAEVAEYEESDRATAEARWEEETGR